MKETVISEYKMQFPARSENESVGRAMVCAVASLMDPTVEELADIRCAVSEAITNAIVHGYKSKGGIVYIAVRLCSGQVFQVEVTDHGCGIANIEEAMQPLYTTDPLGERSGMGFSVMETFMDSLKVVSKVGSGTRVVMRKRFSDVYEGR